MNEFPNIFVLKGGVTALNSVETNQLNSNTTQEIQDQAFSFKDFLALIKIGIVNSNAMVTFTGFWLALHFNNFHIYDYIVELILTMVGSSLIIAGSCAINNYIDRDIDPLMDRTKTRPTVTGKISGKNVFILGISFIVIGLFMLYMATPMAAILGAIGTFTYIYIYTIWTKRAYTINTVVGSLSGAMPPLIGWAAIDENLHIIAWILFFIMFIWQPPHFLALAMKRVEDYRRAGVPMLPVVHGFAITKLQIIIWVICLFPLTFFLYGLGLVFMIIATVLNLGWLFLAIKGFKTKDDIKWSTRMFVYSINYLTIMFLAMIGCTFIS